MGLRSDLMTEQDLVDALEEATVALKEAKEALVRFTCVLGLLGLEQFYNHHVIQQIISYCPVSWVLALHSENTLCVKKMPMQNFHINVSSELSYYPTRARGGLFTDLTIYLYGGTSADLSKIPSLLGGIVICFCQ